MTSYIVAAYTAAPSAGGSWDAGKDEIFYRGLAEIPHLGGIEIAWADGLHTHDEGWLLAQLQPKWDITISTWMNTFLASQKDASFGLASPDEAGRKAAVAKALSIVDGIARINDKLGRQAVTHVHLLSAPGYFPERPVIATPEAFLRSMDELVGHNWHGARLLIEHGDSYVPGQPFTKGFLSLDDEIAVVGKFAGAPVGLSLNWARSLIELRDPQRVLKHIDSANTAGLLKAFIFSGVAAAETAYGPAWSDYHLPFGETQAGQSVEPRSLLTHDLAVAAIARLRSYDYLGLKISWRPADAGPEARVGVIRENLAAVVAAEAAAVERARPTIHAAS